MRKFLAISATLLLVSVAMSAQSYRNSKYYNPRTDRLDYDSRFSGPVRYRRGNTQSDVYYGFRIGPSFSTVNSDDKYLDGGDSQTGLNVGFVIGMGLSRDVPLCLETGLSYVEKGGKSKYESQKMTYDLNYIELPMVLKYRYPVGGPVTLEPFFGGYVACGVGGKIKNFGDRAAYNSFSDDAFKRFDGGLKFGCGLGIDMFYVDVAYDLGLANICHDFFDTSHNRTLSLGIGVNF